MLKPRILIVDDEREIREAIRIYLRGEDIETVMASNGQEAIDLVKQEEIHLVLMDVMMPVMDGLEATRQIRALERADAAEIPIIAMTANAYEEDVRKTREAEMNAHLTKPLDMSVVLATLSEYVKKYDGHR